MRSVLLTLITLVAICHPEIAAACSFVEYRTPAPTRGAISLQMSAFVFGGSIGSQLKCLEENATNLDVYQMNLSTQQAVPGTIVGWIMIQGQGKYSISYGGMNDGSFQIKALWPIVLNAARRLEVVPQHPASSFTSSTDQSILSHLSLSGVNRVALSFQFPVFRDGSRFLPAVEITVTERAPEASSFTIGPVSVPMGQRGSAFSFQIRPWVVVNFPVHLRP